MSTVDMNFSALTHDLAEMPLVWDNRVCTDSFKLMQKFVVLLFKTNETALVDDLGTNFMFYVFGAVKREQGELQNQVNLAVARTVRALQVYEEDDATDLERIASASAIILSSPTPDYLRLDITLTTESGEAIQSELPVKLTGE